MLRLGYYAAGGLHMAAATRHFPVWMVIPVWAYFIFRLLRSARTHGADGVKKVSHTQSEIPRCCC
jgi:hypothetical protein